MDDLRQLLRYEIPGLTTLAYFLVLSYPLLIKLGNNLKIDLAQFGKMLPGLIIIVPIMALPIGFLLFQVYTTLEHENYLKNRDGIKAITRILEKYPCLETEKKWWEKNEKNIARRNEILDTIFYKGERDSAKLLERFESFYHSRRVIGIYSPIAASLAVVITAYFFSVTSWYNLIMIGAIFIFFILVSYWGPIWEKIDKSRKSLYIIPYSLIIGIHVFGAGSKAGLPQFRLIFLVSLIIIISWIMIIPTRKEGALRKTMDNFEENVVLSEINGIIGVIRNRLRFLDC